jgi:hypothetical protein
VENCNCIITGFQDFASRAETIFGASARRGDLEKWYSRMLSVIFDGIIRLSNDGGKTPGEVIRMENFHRLHAILSKLKVSALEPQKKEAKIKYNDALNAYVTKYFGRPLNKLNVRLHITKNCTHFHLLHTNYKGMLLAC